jgi:hypothetical protein
MWIFSPVVLGIRLFLVFSCFMYSVVSGIQSGRFGYPVVLGIQWF